MPVHGDGRDPLTCVDRDACPRDAGGRAEAQAVKEVGDHLERDQDLRQRHDDQAGIGKEHKEPWQATLAQQDGLDRVGPPHIGDMGTGPCNRYLYRKVNSGFTSRILGLFEVGLDAVIGD